MKPLSRWFRRSPPTSRWIEAPMLAARLERDVPPPLILDVRGPDEFTGRLGHITGAINLPLDELAGRVSDLARDGRPVVVVCQTDRRSSTAARRLLEGGASDVSVLRGGMQR